MPKKFIALMSLAGLAAAGTVLAVVLKANAGGAGTQAGASQQLNQDLIQAKVSLEGWQQEANKGNLTSADYQAALGSDLADMHGTLASDMHTF